MGTQYYDSQKYRIFYSVLFNTSTQSPPLIITDPESDGWKNASHVVPQLLTNRAYFRPYPSGTYLMVSQGQIRQIVDAPLLGHYSTHKVSVYFTNFLEKKKKKKEEFGFYKFF